MYELNFFWIHSIHFHSAASSNVLLTSVPNWADTILEISLPSSPDSGAQQSIKNPRAFCRERKQKKEIIYIFILTL